MNNLTYSHQASEGYKSLNPSYVESRYIGSYIKGIDGLRAIAVISVIIYHFDPFLLPGGFAGVDVFFVISGYVVTASLARDSYKKFITFVTTFYARRAIRILPALVFCVVITSLVQTFFMPSPSSWLGNTNNQTGIASLFGVSNLILNWTSGGYFTTGSDFNPFLHTWSLGVEEQFYFIFPLIMFFWLRRKSSVSFFKKNLLLVFLLLTSVMWSWYETTTNLNNAYFLLPSRFWELGCGSLLYKLHCEHFFIAKRSITKNLMFIIGGLFFAFSMLFSEENNFPFPWAILSVGSAMLLISGFVSKQENKFWNKRNVLESDLVIYVGKLSFSLYLWHWPIIVMFKWTVGLETFFEFLSAIVLVFVMAIISYRFIETPIRKGDFVLSLSSTRVLFYAVGAISISVLLLVFVFFVKQNFAIGLSVTKDAKTWFPRAWDYNVVGELESSSYQGRRLFVYGDSHAGAYTTMLSILSKKMGIEVHNYSKGGCNKAGLLKPSAFNPALKIKCAQFNNRSFSKIETLASPGDIVFLPSLGMTRLGKNWELVDVESAFKEKFREENIINRKRALDETREVIEKFHRLSLKIILEAPKPVFPSPPFRCSDWFNSSNPICKSGFKLDREFLEEHRNPVLKAIEILKKEYPFIIVWDPFPLLCDLNECSAFDKKGRPLFYDGDHLSGYGNRVLLPSFNSVVDGIWQPGFDS